MSKGNEAKASAGLLRLMIRLPALRGELQIIHRHDARFQELADAYEEASRMLAELRGNLSCDQAILQEYETICAEIENDVIALCARWRPASR